MQLLFLTPQLPFPPRQGTTIRNFNLLRHLAQRHTIDLLTMLAPGEQLAADNPLHALCRRIAAAPQPARPASRRALDTFTTLTPDMGLRLESAAMWALVDEWTAQTTYDIVQVEGIELAQYGRQVAGRKRGKGPALIFDNHNCEYLLQQRNAFNDLRLPRRWPAAVYSLAQWRKLVRYEAATLNAADAAVAVSEADRQAMLRIAPQAQISVISNGIDLEEYQPSPAHPADLRSGTRSPAQSPKLVFTGKMDYRPNIDAALWFAQEVLPLITAQEPSAVFQLVGMNPHARLDVLAGQPNIEITGAVADTRPYIQGAAVYVIPMRIGGGTRFKVLEAMACAKAIVSTTLGVEGIPVRHEEDLLLADSPADFARQVLQLIADASAGAPRGQALGAAARRFVEARYGWESIIPQFDHLYQQVQPEKGG
jgi:sugar transferase (PEP-CTERM/EpsH1 system associated)